MNTRAMTETHGVTESAVDLFGDHLERFRQHLIDQYHAECTVRKYVHCISILAQMMKVQRIGLEDLDQARASELVAKTGWIGKRRTAAVFMVRRFVRFLSEQGIGKSCLPPTAKEIARAELRADYESYLRHQRGLSERTIFHSWRFADRFLAFRFANEVGDLSQITPIDIARFLQQLTTRRPPFRDKTPSTHLRNFFRYLFKAAKTATNLALGIPSVAQRYGARLPRYLTPGQVETLIGAVRSDTPRGRRNHAMVLLLARLGLRSQEVIAMQIDDIDWRAGEILVRGKGSRLDRVPLPPDVGEALADYIRRDRVTTSRAVFVTERAPHRPYPDGQVLNRILKEAFAKTGLTSPVPYVGSHVLRHSLATSLVQRGASLEEVSDLLRHRSRASTLIYAKLDIEGLRSIAQPWPGAGGAK